METKSPKKAAGDTGRLAVLVILTIFVSCLSIAGMNLDAEGVNVLLPWVPVSSANWPESLPVSRSLGGGTYSVQGVPSGVDGLNTSTLLHDLVYAAIECGLSVKEKVDSALALALAQSAAIVYGQVLTDTEMSRMGAWANRISSLRVIPTGDNAVTEMPDDADAAVCFYDLQGRRILAPPSHGLYMVRKNHLITKRIAQ